MRCIPETRVSVAPGLGKRARLALLALVGVALAAPATAHVVAGSRPLQSLCAGAELVLHARVREVREDPSARLRDANGRPFVEIEVVEALKGRVDAPVLRFLQHGHGVARFEPGDEALVFLLPVSRSRELGHLAASQGPAWVSLQEHDEAYRFAEVDGTLALEAARAYVAAESAASPDDGLALLRRGHLALLTSGDATLAASVLSGLATDPGAAWLTDAERPRLVALLEDGSAPMGVRVGLLVELSRRGMVEPEPHWLALLSDRTPHRDRLTAIRAAASAGGDAVRARLLALLRSRDPESAAAAARALGSRRDPAAVGPLSAALTRRESRVRLAAIRGLGAIRSPEAFAALERSAESHEDAETRRRARAELRARRAP